MAYFRNPHNGYVEKGTGWFTWLWAFLFGSIYFAYKGVWTLAAVRLLTTVALFMLWVVLGLGSVFTMTAAAFAVAGSDLSSMEDSDLSSMEGSGPVTPSDAELAAMGTVLGSFGMMVLMGFATVVAEIFFAGVSYPLIIRHYQTMGWERIYPGQEYPVLPQPLGRGSEIVNISPIHQGRRLK